MTDTKIVRQFSRYFSIGILNTGIHWLVFAILYYLYLLDQANSNLIAFIVAVIFSFFMNAKFTFKQQISSFRFLSYTCFMGLLSYLAGLLSGYFKFPALITLVGFSGISLICGFLYSKFIVFKG